MSLKVARPTLIVNAEDDMVCLAENIREDIVAALPGALLLRSCAFSVFTQFFLLHCTELKLAGLKRVPTSRLMRGSLELATTCQGDKEDVFSG